MGSPNHTSESKAPQGSLDRGGGYFNTTHWSVVLLAGQQDSPSAAAALDRLCRTYWYPLYAYCRRQGYSSPDGEDLTQQFFAVFLAKNSWASATPERGRFRNFLLASFKHFLANEYNRSQSAKRGGRHAFVSWEEMEAEANYQHEPGEGFTPERLFDQAWAFTLLGHAMKKLQTEYTSVGKQPLFDALQVFLTGEKTELTYEEIGANLKMGESAVKMAVSRLRQRYGQMLRREIAHTVADPALVEDELRHLLGVVSR